jgi:sterol desaturase/sphingolipid hydroxylase (fatty acid hydroxylase superfamily)
MEFLLSKIDPTTLSDPSSYAGPLYALFIFIEITFIVLAKKGGDYETRDTAASILMGVGNLASAVLMGGLGLALLVYVYGLRLMSIETTPLMLLILFVADDFRFYWSHRFSHRIRWFWANHVVHHSSQHYNLSTALRQAWFNNLSGMVLIYVPLIYLGVHPGALLFVGSLNLLYQFFIHTETVGQFPRWIEAVINTPSHHRVHHSTKPEYLDTNYGGVLIIWDRLFGTFAQEEKGEKLNYGIIKNLGTFNPLRIATHEFVGIFKDITIKGLSFPQRLAYIFAVPGWSHDGSRETSDDIKRAAKVQMPAE